jgi:hypothetical protein
LVAGGGGGFLDRHYGLRAMEISKEEIVTAKKLAQHVADVVPGDGVFKRSLCSCKRAAGPSR